MNVKSDQIYDAFICHATEDKEAVARPLAQALINTGLKIWYDEFSLELGDSLRQSIERGLVQSRFGIVVISPQFFEKSWPQAELNGLFAKETTGDKVIIPVWFKVEYSDIVKRSPIMADKVAAKIADGIDRVVEQILDVIEKDRLKERQFAKDMRIKTIVESLTDDELLSIAVNIHLNDPDDLDFDQPSLFYCVKPEKFIEKGLIRIIRNKLNEQGRFSWTPFGKVIADQVKHDIPKGNNPLIWVSKKDREANDKMRFELWKIKKDHEQLAQLEREREEMRNRFPFLKRGDN